MANDSSEEASHRVTGQESLLDAAVVSSRLLGELSKLWNKAVMRSEDEFREVEAKRAVWQNRMTREVANIVTSVEDIKQGFHSLQKEMKSMTQVNAGSQMPRQRGSERPLKSPAATNSATGSSKPPEPEASNIQSIKTLESKWVEANAPALDTLQALLEKMIKKVEFKLDESVDQVHERFDELCQMYAGHNVCLDEIMRGTEKNREATHALEDKLIGHQVRCSDSMTDILHTSHGSKKEEEGHPLVEFTKVRPVQPKSVEPNQVISSEQDNGGQEIAKSQCMTRKSSWQVTEAAGRIHSFSMQEDLKEQTAWTRDINLEKDVLLQYIQKMSFVLILLNTVYMGIMLDFSIRDLQENKDRAKYLAIGDNVFTGFFVLEILIRVAIERRAFLWGPNQFWNYFDSFIVAVQCWQTVMSSFANIGFLRMGRIAKLVKLTRTARMMRTLQHVRIARLIVDPGVWQPILMGWACLMCALYFFALIVTSGVAAAVEDRGIDQVHDGLLDLYGSVPTTMMTLFMAITGGDSWGELSKPLTASAAYLKWVLVLFLFAMFFGLMNTVTAMYVDAFIYCSTLDRLMTDRKASDKERLRRLRDMMCDRIKMSGNLIRYDDLCELLRNEGAPILKKLAMDITVAQALYKLLDGDDRGAVDLDEFIYALSNLKGNAQTIYLATVQNQCNKLIAKINRLTDLAEAQLPLVAALHGDHLAVGTDQAADIKDK